MKTPIKNTAIVLGIALVLFAASSVLANETWVNIASELDDEEYRCIAFAGDAAGSAYVAAAGGVYRTKNSGAAWESVLRLSGKGNKANFVAVCPDDPNKVYAATSNGLFLTKNNREGWERIFNGIGKKKNVNCIAICRRNASRIYIGTESGLYVSSDSGKSWAGARGRLSKSAIHQIAIDPEDERVLYAMSDGWVFKSVDKGIGWRRIFGGGLGGEIELGDSAEAEESVEEESIAQETGVMAINPPDTEILYIGTKKGMFISDDGGAAWRVFNNQGLASKNIELLAMPLSEPRDLYASTGEGVYVFSENADRWEELNFDESTVNAGFIAFDPKKKNSVWIAADRGVYRKSPSTSAEAISCPEAERALARLDNEPSIREIQNAAIRYAEVNPEKIKEWREKARKKALLPRLSVGVDKSRSDTYEIYTSSTNQYYMKGPEDETIGWDLNLTWDLGDLVWNDDQTQIDVRSKLMVQLRDDILNEVTRNYFERKKLLIELLEYPPEDTRARIQKQLRIEEFTANVDALTGGYLSDNLE